MWYSSKRFFLQWQREWCRVCFLVWLSFYYQCGLAGVVVSYYTIIDGQSKGLKYQLLQAELPKRFPPHHLWLFKGFAGGNLKLSSLFSWFHNLRCFTVFMLHICTKTSKKCSFMVTLPAAVVTFWNAFFFLSTSCFYCSFHKITITKIHIISVQLYVITLSASLYWLYHINESQIYYITKLLIVRHNYR